LPHKAGTLSGSRPVTNLKQQANQKLELEACLHVALSRGCISYGTAINVWECNTQAAYWNVTSSLMKLLIIRDGGYCRYFKPMPTMLDLVC
jgi:hypothetical protein